MALSVLPDLVVWESPLLGVCSFASHEIDRPVLLAQCSLDFSTCFSIERGKKKELLALAEANGAGNH